MNKATNKTYPCRGEIDPNTIEGKKMIGKMIGGLAEEDKFDLKNENIVEFKDTLEEAVNNFCYGSAAHVVPVEHDEDGTLIQTANLITEPNLCPLDKVMDFAQQTWSNDSGDHKIDSDGTAESDVVVLNQRIRSSPLGMWIKIHSRKKQRKS